MEVVYLLVSVNGFGRLFQNGIPVATEIPVTVVRILLIGLLLWSVGCNRVVKNDAPSDDATAATAESKTVTIVPVTPPFHDAAQDVGLAFRHDNGMIGERYIVEIMAPGCALLDYDRDGDLDLFLVQGRPLSPAGASTQDSPCHRLFRNDLGLDGQGKAAIRFTDVTSDAGLTFSDYGMGAAVGDFDLDGNPDLYLSCFGHDRLLRNNGNHGFVDVTDTAGLTAESAWSTSASWADYDRDGDLDLFVCQYLDWTIESHVPCQSPWGGKGYCGPKTFRRSRCRLYRNGADGTFTDVSRSSQIDSKPGTALGVVAADFDDDGWIDFFVANDAMSNHLWINRRDGTFQEEAVLRGCAVNADGMAEGNMGIIAADFFHTGRIDLFITHLKSEHATFYQNLGDGMFADITSRLGLDAPTRPYTGFGTGAVDYDNDGALDIFLTNGGVQIDPDQERAGISPPLRQRSLLFHNVGTELPKFVPLQNMPFLDLEEIGRGAAFGDLDNDGDVDIVVNNNNGPVRLLLNDVGQRKHWLGLRVVDGPAGHEFDAVATTVRLLRRNRPPESRRCATDGSYLSAGDPRIVFGLGDSTDTGTIRVRWPDGSEGVWENLAADRYHVLAKGQSSVGVGTVSPERGPSVLSGEQTQP